MSYDIFGRKRTKKQRQRDQLERNKRQGRAGEDTTRMNYALRGYEVERTGKGSDFRIRRRDMWTGKVVESKKVEVKTGKAKLSKLQRKTKPKVDRVDPFFF